METLLLAYRLLLVETLLVWCAFLLWANTTLIAYALVVLMCQHCFAIGFWSHHQETEDEELQPLLPL